MKKQIHEFLWNEKEIKLSDDQMNRFCKILNNVYLEDMEDNSEDIQGLLKEIEHRKECLHRKLSNLNIMIQTFEDESKKALEQYKAVHDGNKQLKEYLNI